jgi:ADP-ribosylglycohydrolase
MIGAIAGDVIGSVYEARPTKTKDFPLFDPRCTFTDDSVLTIAVAGVILTRRPCGSARSVSPSIRSRRFWSRPGYGFRISCQETVPEANIAFLDSVSYEDSLRNAISLGGDSDTLACITGGIAQAFYGRVPEHIRAKVRESLLPPLWKVTEEFCRVYRL